MENIFRISIQISLEFVPVQSTMISHKCVEWFGAKRVVMNNQKNYELVYGRINAVLARGYYG